MQSVDALEVGTVVVAVGLDDDEDVAAVANVPGTTVGEYEYETAFGSKSLAETWRGFDVDVNEPVVEVRFAKGWTADGDPATYSESTYGYPLSRLKPYND